MTEPEFWHQYGLRIRKQRKRLKMSQTWLGNLLGVHRNTINRWEHGMNTVDVYQSIRMREIFGDNASTETVT